MSAGFDLQATTRRSAGLDRLGVLLAAIVAAGLALQPFCLFRANRIVAAKPVGLLSALPPLEAQIVLGLIVVASVLLLLRTTPELRLAVSVLTLVLLAFAIGRAGVYLTPSSNTYARVAPGGGFWFAAFAFAIALADAAVRLRMPPLGRLALLALIGGALWLFLWSGACDALSILREYANRPMSSGGRRASTFSLRPVRSRRRLSSAFRSASSVSGCGRFAPRSSTV